MKKNPYLRLVGWGPWALPHEDRRLREAEAEARRTVENTSETRPSVSNSSQSPFQGRGHSHDAMPGLGLTILYRLKAKADCKIGIVTGDILAVSTADIWVNPENTDMEMDRHIGGSISSIIRFYGAERGPSGRGTAQVVSDTIADQLNDAVGDARPVAPGSVFVTDSGQLSTSNNVKYIIHVASVQGEPGVGFRSVRIDSLGRCVKNVLAKADLLARRSPDVRSVLFPLLGTGMGKADLESAVEALVEAAISYLEATADNAIKSVLFLAYDSAEYLALTSVFRNDPRVAPVEGQEAAHLS